MIHVLPHAPHVRLVGGCRQRHARTADTSTPPPNRPARVRRWRGLAMRLDRLDRYPMAKQEMPRATAFGEYRVVAPPRCA